jgi:hypothetical protein
MCFFGFRRFCIVFVTLNNIRTFVFLNSLVIILVSVLCDLVCVFFFVYMQDIYYYVVLFLCNVIHGACLCL